MNSTPQTNGGPSTKGPNGIPLIKRKKAQNDPFFSSRKPAAVPQRPLVNGRPQPPAMNLAPAAGRSSTPNPVRSPSPSKAVVPDAERVSGFSDPRITAEGLPYTDYKLVTTKRELLNGLRYHILQLPSDKPIDIRNEAEFSKPARLHRRDPRSAPLGQVVKEEHEDHKDGLNPAEREELDKRKEARQKEREANLAQIAPSAATARKVNNFKKKTQQVFRPDYTAEEKRRIQTNYEEKLPWHLEDFDNKHCFVGHNQIGSANVHAAFVYEATADPSGGRFRMIPVEKVYHFTPKREAIKTMTIEEVEAAMKKRGSEPEWLTRQKEARLREAGLEVQARKSKGLFSGAQVETIAGRNGEEADLDFDDDFADDEEGDLFVDKDEDAKIAEKKIKEDQLQANFLDFKEENEYDKAEEQEKREAEARKKNFRDIRKALERRERNYNHGSDSEQSYGTSSDSEEERERLEKARLENLAKEEAEGRKSALSSGANTPSGRKEKYDSEREGGLKKSGSSKSLKRPGSPNLSDASATDASTARKKKQKHRHISSTQPTPIPSRPLSPANVPSSSAPVLSNGQLDPSSALSTKSSKKRRSIVPGSAAGSDTEAAAYSDGAAMSDGSKAKRLKLTIGGGSGNRSPNTLTPQGGSRAASPKPQGPPPQQTAQTLTFPTVQEIRSAIPASGITIKDFIALVSHPKERRNELIQLVREVARVDKETKLLMPKLGGSGTV